MKASRMAASLIHGGSSAGARPAPPVMAAPARRRKPASLMVAVTSGPPAGTSIDGLAPSLAGHCGRLQDQDVGQARRLRLKARAQAARIIRAELWKQGP